MMSKAAENSDLDGVSIRSSHPDLSAQTHRSGDVFIYHCTVSQVVSVELNLV